MSVGVNSLGEFVPGLASSMVRLKEQLEEKVASQVAEIEELWSKVDATIC